MKVAFVSQPFAHVGLAGEDSITIWTHRVLAAVGENMGDIIIYCRELPGLRERERRGAIEYRRVPTARDESFARWFRLADRLLHHPRPNHPFFASQFNYLEYGLRVAWDLRSQDCDIVHIHNFSQFVPLVRAFNPQIRIVLHMHCEWLSQLDAGMIESRLEKTDLVIGCSRHVVEKVQARFPQFADRCRVVSNGVDVKRFGASAEGDDRNGDGPKRLLFVGRVSPEKGLHVLLKAMEKVVTQVPDVQLDIIGGFGSAPFEYIVLVSDDERVCDLAVFYEGWRHLSDYPERLQRELSARLTNNVNFLGELPHEQVVAYYHRADMLVNPSLSEAFGLSLVEAMASKIPVVVTSIGGMKEVVEHEKSGLLVEPANDEALAAGLIRLLNEDTLRYAMGEAGRRRVMRLYTWEHVAESLWANYQWVMNRGQAITRSKQHSQAEAASVEASSK